MPRQKTHKGLRSRVRVTRNGKVVRRRAGKSHLMSSKSPKRCRQLRRTAKVSAKLARTVIEKLGGG